MEKSASAHFHDFNKNICMVLAGSEIGVLYNILQNPGSSLYGKLKVS
jgi:hypothetical protein